MAAESQFRCDVTDPEALAALREAPLPLALRGSPPSRSFHRDIYLDTSDRILLARGVSCRLRIRADDRRYVALFIGGGSDGTVERFEAEVTDLDPRQALAGNSEPARRLRGLIDPAQIKPRIELEVERWTRIATSGLLRRQERLAFLYDACTVRHGGLTRTFEELQVRRLSAGPPRMEQVARELERLHGIRPLLLPRHERAAQLAEVMVAESAARMFSSQAAVVLLALDEGRLAFLEEEGRHSLPAAPGSGEEAARLLLQDVTGSGVGDLSLLGALPPSEDRDALEVWVVRRLRSDGDASASRLKWLGAADALARVGTPAIRAPETLAALAVGTRSGLLVAPPRARRTPTASTPTATPRPSPARLHHVAPSRAVNTLPPDHYLNVEISNLAFQERVLEMAEDHGTPLAERLRFLAIVSSNLDEFFAVRVGALKQGLLAGVSGKSLDGLTVREQLDVLTARLPPLLNRLLNCTQECLVSAREAGLVLRTWDELSDAARVALTSYFTTDLLPALTPRAVTQSPGHPFPLIPQLTLTFAVVVQDVKTGPAHFAALSLKPRLGRFLPIPGSTDLIPIEEVVRANLQAFYPDRPVEGAWLFRITRAAELEVNDEEAGDLLQAIEEEVRRRPVHPAVRIEVERNMPERVREMILSELRFERRGVTAALGHEDFYELDPPLDLTVLRDLASRLADRYSYPAAPARAPATILPDRPMFEQIDRGDLFVHHPYEDFSSSVGRFLEEAANDPDVVAIKLTLYRVGERSPVVNALLTAAENGKDVAVFVELKARFDEAHNVAWVRRLEAAGAQVVYGLVGHKIHAKVALVVRRSERQGGLRRYAHISTGNYNAATARFYTDYGLFTADPEITADLTDLFNQLTGSSRAPGASYRKLLIAPATLLAGVLSKIDREIQHAAEGRGGLIRAQLNGLEDPEVVAALYRASAAGVRIELVVRTLCVLRPGLPGISDRIGVKSVLGRFLEHGRIYHFGNGGQAEYLIGSADWRPRNLRRRVEVVTPVQTPALAARLDGILTALWEEPSAWVLGSDGTFVRRGPPSPERPHLHDRLLA